MGNRVARNIKAMVKIFCGLVIAVYIIEGLYVSFMLNNILNRSYANYGMNNPYGNIIDDELFAVCCNRMGFVGSRLLVLLPDDVFNGQFAAFFEQNSRT